MADLNVSCLTCFQPADLNAQLVRSAASIQDALRKHFWFTEADLQQATMCQSCCQQVNNFYRFYSSVEELYHSQISVINVKAEPETDEFNCEEEVLPECSSVKVDYVTEQLENLNSEYNVLSDKEHVESIDGYEDTGAHEPLIEPLLKKTSDQDIAKRKRVKKCLSEDDRIKKHVQYICEQCGHESETFRTFKEHALQDHHKKSPFLICCGKKYRKKETLFQHVQFVKTRGMFSCRKCEKGFKSRRAYRYHRKMCHVSGSVDRIFDCNQCPRSFAIEHHFQQHMENHTGHWNCEKCDKNFNNETRLEQHGSVVHPELPLLSCDVCPKTFRLNYLMHLHKQTHTQQQCQLCPRMLQDRKSLRAHARIIHPDAMVCSICKQVLPTRVALQAHKIQAHWSRGIPDDFQSISRGANDGEDFPESSQKLRVVLTDCLKERPTESPCQIVDSETQPLISIVVKEEPVIEDPRMEIVQPGMKQDPKDSTGNVTSTKKWRWSDDAYIRKHVKFICGKCGYESLTYRLFMKHALEIHDDRSASVACCGKKFQRKDALFQHVQTLNNPNMFRCEDCKINFQTQATYREHLKNIHGDKKFKCDYCSKSYASTSSLWRHRREHLPEKVMKCPHCRKLFTTRRSMRVHINRQHPELLKFVCDGCPKKFSVESWLLEHKEKHKELQCLFCPQRFPLGKHLRKHVLKQHTGVELPKVCTICRDVLPTKDALDAHKVQNHMRQTMFTEEEVKDLPMFTEEEVKDLPELERSMVVEEKQSIEEQTEKIVRHSKKSKGRKKRDDSELPGAKARIWKWSRFMDEYIRKHVKYICKKCGKESLKFVHFVDHALDQHGDESPSIECCGKIFRRKLALYEHVHKTNNPTFTIRCEHCDKSYDNKSAYRQHVIRQHVIKTNFKCNQCSKWFANKRALKIHMRDRMYTDHHLDSDLTWVYENDVYPNGTSLPDQGLELPSSDAHEAQEHENQSSLVSTIVKSETKVGDDNFLEDGLPECSNGKSVEAEQREKTKCDGGLNNPTMKGLAPHELNKLKQLLLEETLVKKHVQYKCDHCDVVSLSFGHFKHHVRHAHNVAAVVRCCGKRYDQRSALFQHVQLINNPDAFLCKHCPKRFTSKQMLKLHVQKLHRSEPETTCQKSLDDEDVNTHHLKDHAVPEDIIGTCEHCNATFKNHVQQDRHIRMMHINAPKTFCDVCCAGFVVKEWFLKHMQVHDREDALAGMFKCGLCSECFIDKTQRKLHVQDHAGWEMKSWAQQFAMKPPYVCTLCSKAFRTQPMFQQHNLKHEKPALKCTDCPKTVPGR